MKSRNNKQRSLVLGLAISASTAVLAMLVVLNSQAVGQDGERSSKLSAGEQDAEMLRRVEQLPNLPIIFETQEAAPLSIQEAHVKEITQADFQRLTGAAAESLRYAAFPNVSVLNSTDRRLTGFALFLRNKTTGRTHFIKITRTSIEPHGGYSVRPSDWVIPERLVQGTTGPGEAKIIRKPAGFDSGKMWLEAGADDLALKVIEAYFEDGSTWSNKSSF